MSSELSDADKEKLEQMTLLDPALLKAKKKKPVTSLAKTTTLNRKRNSTPQPKKKPGVWKSGKALKKHCLLRRARGARTDPASKGMDAHCATTRKEGAGTGDCAEANSMDEGTQRCRQNQKKRPATAVEDEPNVLPLRVVLRLPEKPKDTSCTIAGRSGEVGTSSGAPAQPRRISETRCRC